MFSDTILNKINNLKKDNYYLYILLKILIVPLIYILVGILIIQYLPILSFIYVGIKTILFLYNSTENNIELLNNWLSCCFIYLIHNFNNYFFNSIMWYFTSIIISVFSLDILLLRGSEVKNTTFPIMIYDIIKKISIKYNNSELLHTTYTNIVNFENIYYPIYRLYIYNNITILFYNTFIKSVEDPVEDPKDEILEFSQDGGQDQEQYQEQYQEQDQDQDQDQEQGNDLDEDLDEDLDDDKKLDKNPDSLEDKTDKILETPKILCENPKLRRRIKIKKNTKNKKTDSENN